MKNLFYLFAFILIFASCSENLVEVNSSENGNNDIEVREGSDGDFECMPGAYTEDEGLIKFQDANAFVNTLNFFTCASSEEIDAWRATLSTYTSKKAYEGFKEASSSEDLNSFEELLSLENQYQDKIRIRIDEVKYERSYDVEFKHHNEIVNTEGLFMIGDKYARVIGNRLLVVTNGTRNFILSLNQNTPSTDGPSSDGGVEISNTELEPRGDCDCPIEKKEERVYYDNGTKKLSIEYWFETEYYNGDSPVYGEFSEARLYSKGRVKHERKKSYILWSVWVKEEASLKYDAYFAGDYTLGDINDPDAITAEGSFTSTLPGILLWTDENVYSDFIAFISTDDTDNPVEDVFTVCLDEAEMTGVNTDNGVSRSYVCGAEDEFLSTPKIIFYEDNNCTGSEVCTVELDPSVGHINFKNYAPCSNDEARSAKLVNMKQGMKLRVFDHPEMNLNDDYTVMTIKSDFAEKNVDTFEADFNDSQLNVNYYPINGLDGKVSSFIDQ